jgi:hypothetical protein
MISSPRSVTTVTELFLWSIDINSLSNCCILTYFSFPLLAEILRISPDEERPDHARPDERRDLLHKRRGMRDPLLSDKSKSKTIPPTIKIKVLSVGGVEGAGGGGCPKAATGTTLQHSRAPKIFNNPFITYLTWGTRPKTAPVQGVDRDINTEEY